MKIVIYFLALIDCVSLLYLGVRNLTTTAVANSDTWNSTWTAVMDSDYGSYFINREDDRDTFRTFCQNRTLTGCPVIDGDMANNNITSSPANVVGWNVSGVIGGFNFTENWLAGDGTGPETDFYFTQKAFAGPTHTRDYVFIHFMGEAKLIRDDRGTDNSLTYKWSAASTEGNNMRDCRTLGVCIDWLRWGERPNQLFNQTNIGYGPETSQYMNILEDMSPGVPAKWTVTGRIN